MRADNKAEERYSKRTKEDKLEKGDAESERQEVREEPREQETKPTHTCIRTRDKRTRDGRERFCDETREAIIRNYVTTR